MVPPEDRTQAMNTTAHENETLELTLDDLDAVSAGSWVEALWNAIFHPSSGGGSSTPHGSNSTSISNSGNGVGNS
jgi:hypothetical protein